MTKEVDAYEKEVVYNEGRIQKMRDEGIVFYNLMICKLWWLMIGKDPYDIRKQEEVLSESYMMVPDSKRRYIEYKSWVHQQSWVYYISNLEYSINHFIG